jgi:hypothetical protein
VDAWKGHPRRVTVERSWKSVGGTWLRDEGGRGALEIVLVILWTRSNCRKFTRFTFPFAHGIEM